MKQNSVETLVPLVFQKKIATSPRKFGLKLTKRPAAPRGVAVAVQFLPFG